MPKAGSANAGGLYVKEAKGGDYLGKVVGGQFVAAFGTPAPRVAEIKAALAVIATDPAAAAVRYGKATGICSCCGRALTDPASVEAGIGPICAEAWQF